MFASYNPYLGEEPPADAYASMDVDDEYEGGEWIDGEFYARKRDRPARSQTKAEALYGVWADDEDEDEENDRRAAKQNKRRDEELISDDDEPVEEEVVEAGNRRGLGLGASRSQRGAGKHGKRQAGSGQGSSLLSRTMNFVASSTPPAAPSTDEQPPVTAQPSTSQPSAASTAAASAASASDAAPVTTLSFKRRRLAQQAEINRQKQPDSELNDASSATTPAAPLVRAFRPPTVDAGYAAFTAHSSPFVLQMMERMGFRGRLGKHETGVALPILPQLRPKGVGLGGVKEQVQRVGRNAEEEEKIEQEKEKERERRKNEKAGRREVAPVAGAGVREKAWKKGGERKGKTVYKTAHEVIQEHSKHPTTTPTVIIDMTSGTPVQKQLSALSSSSSASPATAAASASQQPSACPELVHNVQLLCDLCENEIVDTERRMERLTLDTDEMTREQARLTAQARKGQEAEERLRAVVDAVEEVKRRLEESECESVGVRVGVVEQFHQRLQRQYVREWRMYGLVRVVVVLLLPLLRELAGRWEVLPAKAPSADARDELFEQLKRWRLLLDESTSAVWYDELVNALLLPPLRLALSSASLSLQHPTPIVSLFQQLRAVLPVRLYSSVVSSLLLPRLQRLLGAYNPRSTAAPYWLLSYGVVLSSEELQSLAGVVRQRLQLTMGGWRVEDEVERKRNEEADEVEEVGGAAEERMVDRVAGWKGVWKEDEMDAFLSRYIQPRLLAAITSLRSSADSSPFAPLPLVSAVLAWSPLFAPLVFTPVLAAVLSHFLSVLHGLLSQRDADYELAGDAYEQWKAALTVDGTAHRALVDEVSRRALSMMNTAMDDGGDVGGVYRNAAHYLRQQSAPSTPAAAQHAADARRSRAAVAADREGRSMRDVLYAFGAQHGFDVYPHARRSVSGHEVYWFGGVQVYWSGEDVHAMNERSKEWELVSLSQLLQLAKQAQARCTT